MKCEGGGFVMELWFLDNGYKFGGCGMMKVKSVVCKGYKWVF